MAACGAGYVPGQVGKPSISISRMTTRPLPVVDRLCFDTVREQTNQPKCISVAVAGIRGKPSSRTHSWQTHGHPTHSGLPAPPMQAVNCAPRTGRYSMDNENTPPLPAGIAEAIERAAQAAELAELSPAQRRKHHGKVLRGIAFYKGADGVAAYKKDNPEAASIWVDIKALASPPKPQGYDQYLVNLAEQWLTSDAALRSTNVADVEQLNRSLGAAFTPANHFNAFLSVGRRKKIRSVFAKYGAPLDMDNVDTLSKVRAAAQAARANRNADRTFGDIGVISGRTLSIRGRSYLIETHGGRESIRITIDDKRPRFYLDDLKWIAEWFVDGRDDPLHNTEYFSIGELAQTPETLEIGSPVTPETSGLAQSGSSMRDRINALKVSEGAPDKNAEDEDPLNLP